MYKFAKEKTENTIVMYHLKNLLKVSISIIKLINFEYNKIKLEIRLKLYNMHYDHVSKICISII